MASVYCEFCGKEANTGIRDLERYIGWLHKVAKNVVRCDEHQCTSKMVPSCRTYDPCTGENVAE